MNYFKLYTKSELRLSFLELAKNNKSWENQHSFDVLNLTNEFNNFDLTLNYFIQNFDAKPFLLKLSPNTFYRFHVDSVRKCAINMLLDGNDSHCYFGKMTKYEEVIDNVSELVYEKDYYYLFNTKEKHAILNLNNYRYMLSVGIENYDFFTVLQSYKNNFYAR